MGEHLGIVARENKPWAPGVQSVSIKHEAILNFLLINPTAKLRDVADYFGVTQPWLFLRYSLRTPSSFAFGNVRISNSTSRSGQ